ARTASRARQSREARRTTSSPGPYRKLTKFLTPRADRKRRRTRKLVGSPRKPCTSSTGVGCGARGSNSSAAKRGRSGIDSTTVASAESSLPIVPKHAHHAVALRFIFDEPRSNHGGDRRHRNVYDPDGSLTMR